MESINKEFVLKVANELINIDSPSSYTKSAINYLKENIAKFNFETTLSNKGNLIVSIPGKDTSHTIGLSAHVDTLGLMVRSIKSDGKLAFTRIGGPMLPTLDGEYCRILTREGKIYTGTILSTTPAAHVFPDATSAPRKEDTMEIRIDEIVYSKEDTEKLGIQNGDIIAIEPKFTVTEAVLSNLDFWMIRFLPVL